MAYELKLRCAPLTLVLFLACSVGVCASQVSREFRRTFAVSLAEPVSLEVDLMEANLHIAYARDGEVSISVAAQDRSTVDPESLANRLVFTRTGNHLEVGERPCAAGQNIKLTYTIDVPYRTEVRASVRRGNQTITGILGPVTAKVGVGNIEVSYVSLGVAAQVKTGNLNFEVVGGKVEAQTGQGNISCQRAPQGISAETQSGDISLAVIGPSTAIVKSGNGRIDVGGARGGLLASTRGGEVHVKAVTHEDWQLSSVSGTVRVELPPGSKFDLDATTDSGEIVIARGELERPNAGVRRFNQRANGGGKRIEVHTKSGRIVVS